MSDEREGRPRPDETRPFSFDGGREDVDGGREDFDGGREDFDGREDFGRGRGDDATRPQPPIDRNNHPFERPQSGDAWVFDRPDDRLDDRTRVQGDRTSVMPGSERDDWGTAAAGGAAAAGAGAWAGRAEVPAARPPQQYTESDWTTTDDREPRGRWWMPILVGLIALILLALLGWGIWLIIQAQNKNDNTPVVPVPTLSAPTETSSPSATPTTTPPTTQATTTTPTPAAVTVPPVRGKTQSQAQSALSKVGLSSRLKYVTTDQAPAGIVIDSDPGQGKEVPPDTTVTLIVASKPSPSPTSTDTPGPIITLPPAG